MVHTLEVFVYFDCLSISALQALCTYLHASRLHVVCTGTTALTS
jgi:hypothetical protein